MEKLQREIESARRKLDDAIARGCSEQMCYRLSLELDRLIEYYIILEERTSIPVA